jgi:hypothetical protein
MQTVLSYWSPSLAVSAVWYVAVALVPVPDPFRRATVWTVLVTDYTPPFKLQVASPATTSQPLTSPLGLPAPDPAMVVTPLLGSPSSLYELYASQIAAIVFASGYKGRGVIVGLALNKRTGGAQAGSTEDDEAERDRFVGVMEMVSECTR